MKMKNLLLLSVMVIGLLSACQNRQSGQTQQIEQNDYFHWICQQGEHKGTEIIFTRIDNIFCGTYTDPDFPKYSIPIMGMIDNEGNVTGISEAKVNMDNTSFFSAEIAGKLSGKITGNNFSAIWSPTPNGMEMSQYREMELVLNCSDERKNFDTPALSEPPFPGNVYGYTIGEWERKLITLERGKEADKEVVFIDFLIAEDNGIEEIMINFQGKAPLNGNSFRYKEKDCEFEITEYNGFITLKTISGNWNGYKADGVYPKAVAVVW